MVSTFCWRVNLSILFSPKPAEMRKSTVAGVLNFHGYLQGFAEKGILGISRMYGERLDMMGILPGDNIGIVFAISQIHRKAWEWQP